jgi:hypothetical protein
MVDAPAVNVMFPTPPTGPRGLTGPAGEPGDNVESVGLVTSLPGVVLGAGVKRVRTIGYTVLGRGAADYIYDATVNQAHVTANPRTSFLAADGRGFRLATNQMLNIDMFGATANGVADDYPAFAAALAYCKKHGIPSIGGDNSTLVAWAILALPLYLTPGHRYFCSQTLEITAAINLVGASNEIKFPAGKHGIIIQSKDTFGFDGTIADVANYSQGAGSRFYGITLRGSGGGGKFHGWVMRGNASLYDCSATEFSGDGAHIVADVGIGPNHGNANSWLIVGGSYSANGRHGIYTQGGDVNAGMAMRCSADGNARYGVCDQSFLGNIYVGLHTMSNGVPGSGYNGQVSIPTVASYGGKEWSPVYGKEVQASTTVPGPDGTVWSDVSGQALGAVPWVTGMTWQSGGAYLSGAPEALGNYTVFIGCYGEQDQVGYAVHWPGAVIGGLMFENPVSTCDQLGAGVKNNRVRTLTIEGARFSGSTSALTQYIGKAVSKGERWFYDKPDPGGYIGYICTTSGIIGSTAVLKEFGKIEL